METSPEKNQQAEDTIPAPQVKAPERKLSKAEQRVADKQKAINDRAAKESSRIHSILCTRFADFFVTAEDPEGEDVREFIRRAHGQWVMHCKRWNLNSENFHAVKKYCENLIHEYKKAKYDGEIPPDPEPQIPAEEK